MKLENLFKIKLLNKEPGEKQNRFGAHVTIYQNSYSFHYNFFILVSLLGICFRSLGYKLVLITYQ